MKLRIQDLLLHLPNKNIAELLEEITGNWFEVRRLEDGSLQARVALDDSHTVFTLDESGDMIEQMVRELRIISDMLRDVADEIEGDMEYITEATRGIVAIN